ncbi:glycosyl hydrolase 108 family protein [Variovorax sp. J2P1-59]|uniref:glycoside hydrolase family 108 protein n=1 Tax=Variovorax flavidus TaxID=3053501 RepID=UPI002575E283|nr:N-acetylmuramidase [Variovorax sp. J2P1-59]MDM0075096.1 glycosyl hydrolase 108 family protein [Variovorax sp. J2P1-59]
MSNYADARAKLDNALNFVEPDGPEWIKTKAAIAALDEAEVAEIARDFINASRRLDDAVAKLKAILAGLTPNPASQFLGEVRGALQLITPVAQNVEALLSGEPASALPGTPVSNTPSFPTAAEPSVPPVREFSRDIAEQPAAHTSGVDAVDAMIEDILRREGGFVDHPNDRGGPTNFGITLRSLASWRGSEVSRDDVRRMAQTEARDIYKGRYFIQPKINDLPAAIQPLMFDMCVHHGPGTAIKLLQEVLQASSPPCAVDGGIGDKTIQSAANALAALGAKALVNLLVDRRVELFKSIAGKDASQKVFLKGWLRRAEEFRQA